MDVAEDTHANDEAGLPVDAGELEDQARNIRSSEDQSVAVFIDLENIYYSVYNNFSEPLDWPYIVDLCKNYGRLASVQAFGDWINFQDELRKVQKNGIQPIFVPPSRNGKSSLDCYLTVSAMKLFFQNNNIDTMILASGDRDYIPLIAELKALGRKVRILAIPDTLSSDLRSVADSVIEYEAQSEAGVPAGSEKSVTGDAEDFIVSVISGLEETSPDGWVNLAAIGLGLHEKDPEFSHKHYGYEKLADMLGDVASVEMKYDNYEKTIALARVSKGQQSQPQGTASSSGTIFSVKEGYGFISPDEGGENVFFHYSKVRGNFSELMRGDRVSYSTYLTERGPNAENVEKIP